MKGLEQSVRWLVGASMAAAVAFVIAGCETATGLAGLAMNTTEVTMTAEESDVTLTVVGVTGDSTNTTMSLPLTWTVSDPTLGYIAGVSGFSATYVRNDASGHNTVVVKDQYDNEGYVSINQLSVTDPGGTGGDYTLVLTVTVNGSATTEIPDGYSQAVITVSGENAQSPFTWAVTSGGGSIVSGQGGYSAVFQSDGVGSSAVQCTDDNGVVASVSITQAAPVVDGNTGSGTGGGGPGDP